MTAETFDYILDNVRLELESDSDYEWIVSTAENSSKDISKPNDKPVGKRHYDYSNAQCNSHVPHAANTAIAARRRPVARWRPVRDHKILWRYCPCVCNA